VGDLLLGDGAIEVVGAEESGDPVAIPAPVVEDPTRPAEPAVDVVDEPATEDQAGGWRLPCPGAAFLLGAALLPLTRRR